MKTHYAVKDEKTSAIFKCYDEAMKLFKTLANAKIKGFYSEKEALTWLNKPIKNDEIFVVLAGKKPGIYFSAEEMKVQVNGFAGAKVGRAKTIEQAEMMFANRNNEINKPIKQKEDPEMKKLRKITNLKSLTLKYKGDVLCFIDCEASDGKAISLGAVVYDKSSHQIIDSFYSLMKPDNFVKIDQHVSKLTNLTTKEINEAKNAKEVIDEFLSFLSMHNVTDIFSWSNNDKSFLSKNVKDKTFNMINDIQPYISAVSVDKYYCKNWSLDNMLYVFGYNKPVVHNALSDAKDLLNVYIGWINNNVNEERLNELISKRCSN